MATLDAAGISIDAVTDKLVEEGVQLFADAFDKLLGAVAQQARGDPRRQARRRRPPSCPADLDKAVEGNARGRGAATARSAGCGPATPRSGPAPTKPSGSAGSTSSTSRRSASAALQALSRGRPAARLHPCGAARHGRLEPRARSAGARPSASRTGSPQLLVLDSTDPGAGRTDRKQIDLARTLFIVSSKSGSTLEPNVLKRLLLRRVEAAVGADARRLALHRHHRSRLEAAEGGRARRLPPYLLRNAEHRRALFGAVGLRHGAGRRMGLDRRRLLDTHGNDGALLRRPTCRRPTIRVSCWARSSAARQSRPRQGDDRRLARHRRFRRLAGAAAGRIDRQAGQGPHPRRREPLGRRRRLRQRPRVRLSAAARQSPMQRRTTPSTRWKHAGHPVVRIAVTDATTSARNSSAGRSPPRSPARSSASIRSTSPTSRQQGQDPRADRRL